MELSHCIPFILLYLSLNVAALAPVGPQVVNFKLLEQDQRKNVKTTPFTVQDSRLDGLLAVSDATAGEFPEQWFAQPLDHFTLRDSPTFKQRYWVNKRHYVPGQNAPVIVIDGGEASGEERLPFLDTGIAEILAKATGGIGVVLEHRYVFVFLRVFVNVLFITLFPCSYYGQSNPTLPVQ